MLNGYIQCNQKNIEVSFQDISNCEEVIYFDEQCRCFYFVYTNFNSKLQYTNENENIKTQQFIPYNCNLG